MAFINDKQVYLRSKIEVITDDNGSYDEGYEIGYEEGYNKAESVNPLPYIKTLTFGFNGIVFPENFHFKLNLKKTPSDLNSMCKGAVNIKIATLSSEDKSNKIQMYSSFNNNKSLELLDLTNFNNNFSGIGMFVSGCPKLKTILGAINLSNCTQTTYAFTETTALENIEFEPNTIPISIDFATCKYLTHDSLMSIINGLMAYAYDITGNPFQENHPDMMTNGKSYYTIENVVDEGNGNYYIETTDDNTGNDCHFYCHGEMLHSEEITNALKVGAKFIIDCTITFENGEYKVNYNNFKISTGTTQTLTLGTTNLNKLTNEEKAIATEKGWNLV